MTGILSIYYCLCSHWYSRIWVHCRYNTVRASRKMYVQPRTSCYKYMSLFSFLLKASMAGNTLFQLTNSYEESVKGLYLIPGSGFMQFGMHNGFPLLRLVNLPWHSFVRDRYVMKYSNSSVTTSFVYLIFSTKNNINPHSSMKS
jgi:hypothetical protein